MDLSVGAVRQPNQRPHRKGRSSMDRGPPPYSAGQMDYPPMHQEQPLYDPSMTPGASPHYGAGYGAPGQVPPPMGGFYPGTFAPGGGGVGPGQPFLNDPMANMAMAYGQTLMGQGKQMVDQKLEKYVPISKLKYYFAVDTTYVRRKLTLLLFPFANTDWSIKYNQDEPVAPRYELNAPDLYIPVMAFVTFILLAGITLGTQNKFSPEQLGVQASSALGWLVLEVIVLLLTTYIMNIQTDLGYLDFLAFCSYKYVGMIACICAGLFFMSIGYYVVLLYTSIALCYFLVKTLRIQVNPKSMGDHLPHGNKRRMYLLLCIAVIQPLIMFWLTRRLIPQPVATKGLADGGTAL